MINYNGRIFKSISNTDNGEVNTQTIFRYYQEGNVVWAEYSGGKIVKGFLIAKTDENGNLDMKYEHINHIDEIMTGQCHSKPEVLHDGRIRLHERWEWTSGDFSKGSSIIEEVLII